MQVFHVPYLSESETFFNIFWLHFGLICQMCKQKRLVFDITQNISKAGPKTLRIRILFIRQEKFNNTITLFTLFEASSTYTRHCKTLSVTIRSYYFSFYETVKEYFLRS